MSWTVPDIPEPGGSMTDGERETLTGYLGFQRRTLLRICGGLDGEQLVRRSVRSTELTLLGIVRHLRKVERIWFRERFGGEDLAPMYRAATEFTELDASVNRPGFSGGRVVPAAVAAGG